MKIKFITSDHEFKSSYHVRNNREYDIVAALLKKNLRYLGCFTLDIYVESEEDDDKHLVEILPFELKGYVAALSVIGRLIEL